MFEIASNGKMTIISGDTATFTVTIEGHTLIEGDKAFFTVRKDTKESRIEIQKTATEFMDNQFVIELLATDTAIQEGEYLYDVQLSLADGSVDTVIKPTRFSVKGGVTP